METSFLGGPNSAESMNGFVSHSLFQFSKFYGPKLFVIHEISMHSPWFRSTFLRFLKFLQIIETGPNFRGEPNSQKVWIIWSPLLYFNFKNFMKPIYSSFIRFQRILYDSGVPFSDIWNRYKLKRKTYFLGGTIFAESLDCFVASPPPCFISLLNVLWTKTLHYSLDFNVSCMIQEYLSKTFEVSTPILQKIWIICSPPPSVFQF